ncbi:MAG: beta-ketoacyl-[acyl-carrier-protein] synthase family protein [Sedimentisphaerales bacterium]|nr:beta-ketoacyl-[acyl-carrier-protein] synthase family protein [Sedimentisphaerales bacterium]MBN2843174.1 beta-ketoacyl-[acyl-carrier-protein] synthase family protein [Sedimentisphaerales bacterium]
MTRRVVITGMGTVNPLGHDVETTWKNLLECRCGIEMTELFDASTYPTKFSAEVKDWSFWDKLPQEIQEKHKNAARNSKLMIAAAYQAWQQAKLPASLNGQDQINAGKVGVYLGAGEGPVDFDNFIAAAAASWDNTTNSMAWDKWAQVASSRLSAEKEIEQEPNMPAAHLASIFGLRGPCYSCLTACAASTQAIGEATELIRNGQADILVTGGAHSMIHPLGVTGFNRLTALSTRNDDIKTSSRPFEIDRDGFVMAEGGSAIILEELESALKRGATILAEVVGYGSTADAFRITDQHETGRGGAAAVKLALEDAGMKPEDIDYISAHGTGTSENDKIETLVIKSVFGEQAYKTPISSVKSMLGHLIAAAGATELITCITAIRDNIMPPTTNLKTPAPECDLDYIPNAPRKAQVDVCMSNSFGFGGQNNTIIIKKFSRDA